MGGYPIPGGESPWVSVLRQGVLTRAIAGWREWNAMGGTRGADLSTAPAKGYVESPKISQTRERDAKQSGAWRESGTPKGSFLVTLPSSLRS